MFSRQRRNSSAVRLVVAAGLLCIAGWTIQWLSGCATSAPWLHHADDKPFYESTYFRVVPPQGSGWKGSELGPSSTLEHLGFKFEPELFDDVIPLRICFEKYTTTDIIPHGTGRTCYVECYSTATEPDSFDNNPRLIAEAENRRDLPESNARTDTRSTRDRGSERGVVKIGARDYHEFADPIDGSGGRSQYLLQYITFSKDLRLALVTNVRSGTDVLPEDARAIIEGLEWTDSTASPSPAQLALQRGARGIYNLTLTKIDGRPSDEDMREIEKTFADVLKMDPQNAKAHFFLAAAELLAEDPGPAFKEAKCEAVKMGLWDFFCVNDKSVLLHSLFDGYELAEKATEHLDAAVRANPRSFWASYYLAGLLIRNGEYTRAEGLARSITENYPESALGWYELGMALKRNGKSAEAKKAFSEALYNNRGEFAELWRGSMRGKTIIDWQLKTLERGR